MVKDERKVQLIAHVPEDVGEAFKAQCNERAFLQYRALTAAVRLWTDLPAEVQAQLVNQSMDAGMLIALVREIVSEAIAEGQQFHKQKPHKGGG